MSLLAASRRVALRASTPAHSGARRHLGDGVRGPPLGDFGANLTLAKEFFSKGSVSYVEFKQQCQSLRLFTFFGVTAGCALCLAMDPPKSSYWQRYSPRFWFSNLTGAFAPASPPLFLSSKAEYETDVPDVVQQLITTRRVKGQGGEEEEH
eukprot:TRINITY_DN80621_c0_g1_i1.p1 TRINITY_DN80621_c0_g1~~TRINITY_DN80621_c0_g1_i1.p1  ORF type:complete len:151 (-),score=30.33 TRINITY_DN80621_c0_g1_i1:248-700(-)